MTDDLLQAAEYGSGRPSAIDEAVSEEGGMPSRFIDDTTLFSTQTLQTVTQRSASKH